MKIKSVYLYFLLISAVLISKEILVESSVSPKNATILALLISLICLSCFFLNKKISLIGITGVILIYMILTQFGLIFVYFFLGGNYLVSYSSYTLRFLDSPQLTKAIFIGIIAVITYTVAANIDIVIKDNGTKFNKKKPINSDSNVLVRIGYTFLFLVFLFYSYYILTGAFIIGGSYTDFRVNVIENSSIYPYILMLYSMGIIFVISAGNIKQIKIGIFLYCLTAGILLLTGNKGEVLYSALACVGVAKYRGFKINGKITILGLFIAFFLIPFITASREIGIKNVSSFTFGFTDAFTEIGMQLRVSVYVLEEFARGTRHFMRGFSYYDPMINILDKFIPFVDLKIAAPADYNFLTEYAGMGFSQVAESYSNFGLIGVVFFFFIIGKLIAQKEKENMNIYQLSFWGCVTSILINATRNRFSFVFGQMLIIYVIISMITIYDNHKIWKASDKRESFTNYKN